MTSTSGNAQNGTVGLPLANPLQVIVTEDGQPSAGVTVTWATTAPGGAMSPPSGPTNADGVASSTWTVGTAAGGQTAQATVAGAAGSPVTFTATAAAGAAASIAKEPGGDGQTAEVGTQLALPLQARVTDEHGNGVGGTTVGWGATGGTVSSAAVPTAETGLSSVTVTAGGTAGPITITAEAAGLAGSPLTFTATAVEAQPTPSSIDVTVRNDNFLSVRNGTVNPAVDTVLAGGTVTWTWAPTTSNPHDVTSTGSPSFPGRATAVQPPPYSFTFSTPGTYSYYCTVHGAPTGGMRGRIVVR
jgi:plastocyanin